MQAFYSFDTTFLPRVVVEGDPGGKNVVFASSVIEGSTAFILSAMKKAGTSLRSVPVNASGADASPRPIARGAN